MHLTFWRSWEQVEILLNDKVRQLCPAEHGHQILNFTSLKTLKRYKANQIRDLKTHIGDEHNIKNGLIEHLKIDRNDCSEVSETLRQPLLWF